MRVSVGVSNSSDTETAIKEAMVEVKSPSLVLFFAPVSLFKKLSEALHTKFPSTIVIGTTSAYMYSQSGLSYNSVCIVSFADGIKVSGGVIEEIKRYPMKYAPRVKEAQSVVPHENTVCFEFTTAFSNSEELVLATLNSVCTEFSIPVFGGTAGTNSDETNDCTESYISYNGAVHTDASVFFFIHNVKGRIALIKENIYTATSSAFTATSVDVKNRIISELDGQPVSKVFCSMLHCIPSELPGYLSIYPLGRMVGSDLYISDFNKIYDDGSISWHTRIYNGTRVCLVKPDDYAAITKQTFDKIHAEIKTASFTLLIHCIARTLYYKQIEYLDEYARLCGKNLSPLAGFSSTGEQLGNVHLNQTMIAAVFE